jgi:hypothetical protein
LRKIDLLFENPAESNNPREPRNNQEKARGIRHRHRDVLRPHQESGPKKEWKAANSTVFSWVNPLSLIPLKRRKMENIIL